MCWMQSLKLYLSEATLASIDKCHLLVHCDVLELVNACYLVVVWVTFIVSGETIKVTSSTNNTNISHLNGTESLNDCIAFYI